MYLRGTESGRDVVRESKTIKKYVGDVDYALSRPRGRSHTRLTSRTR